MEASIFVSVCQTPLAQNVWNSIHLSKATTINAVRGICRVESAVDDCFTSRHWADSGGHVGEYGNDGSGVDVHPSAPPSK